MDNKLAVVTEDRSVIKEYEDLNIVDKRIIDSMTATFSMSKEQAIETYFDESKWSEFVLQNQRRFQVMFASLAEPLKKEIELKIEKGSLEQVRAGMTALAIANDKWGGSGRSGQSPVFNVMGKQITIKTSFDFRPYNKNWKEEKLQQVKEIGDINDK